MRNYCSISDLKDPDFVQRMYEVFDDEFFLLLKRNSPQYIGVPYRFGKEIAEMFNYGIREISTTQIIRREALLSDESDWKDGIAYLLIADGTPRYFFFPHEPYLADRVHSLMKEVLHSEFLSRNGIESVTARAYENR